VGPDALLAAILMLLPPGVVVSVDPAPPGLTAREGRPVRLFPESLPLDPLGPAPSPRPPFGLGEGHSDWLDELDVELESDLGFLRLTFTVPF